MIPSSRCLRSCRPVIRRLQRSAFSSQAQISSGLTEEQQDFQEVAMTFARRDLLPNAAQWDQHKQFSVTTLRQAAELGVLRYCY